jgi:thiol-disulfide isomerase/thioredoxin
MLTPYGAAIEVEGRLLLDREGRGAAIRYFEEQLAAAKAPSLQSRIRKNLNLLTLEGQTAPPLDASRTLESLRGKPVLLFFFAEWCGDCKAQAPALARVWEKYKSKGLAMVAATRLYSTPADEKPMTPDEEKAQVRKVWSEVYTGLQDVPVVIDNDSMIRYGGSATPTFALVDRKGVVRLYTPTRLSEAELSRQVERVLAE